MWFIVDALPCTGYWFILFKFKLFDFFSSWFSQKRQMNVLAQKKWKKGKKAWWTRLCSFVRGMTFLTNFLDLLTIFWTLEIFYFASFGFHLPGFGRRCSLTMDYSGRSIVVYSPFSLIFLFFCHSADFYQYSSGFF